MSDCVIMLLILCITYVTSLIINKSNHSKGKHETHRKDGTRL